MFTSTSRLHITALSVLAVAALCGCPGAAKVSGCDDVTCPATGPEAGFKVYPPRLIRKDMTGIEFEQALIPLSAAATVIPALSFTSFDARAGEYQTYRQGPYRLTFHAKRAIDRSQQYRPSPPESTREADAASAAALALRVPEKGGAEVVAAHEAAAQAYASGYYEAALEAYAELSEEAPAWLLFNRGIIQLGAGQYGQAIAQLMRSLHAEPRNAETRRALEHACRIAGVTPADWVGDWKERFRRHPRWEHTAIVSDPVAARLAPAGSARGLFDCKPGQVVSVGEQSGTWLSIRRGGNMGWVPAHAVTRLGSAE